MIRVLVLIAVAGFFVALLSLAGAAGLGGADIARNGWKVPAFWNNSDNWNYSDDNGSVSWNGPTTTRELSWDGERFEISVPADITYTQGPVAKLTVEGPQEAVDRVVMDGGHLRFDSHRGYRNIHGNRFKVTLTAPSVTQFRLEGSERLTIADYKQDELEVHIAGSGNVEAKGEARHVELHIAGSGDANLGGLKADEVKVSIAGSGNATVAPKDSLETHVAGAGDITLLTRPPNVEQHTAGSGHIIYRDPTAEETAAQNGTALTAAAPATPANPATPAEPAKPVLPSIAAKPSAPAVPAKPAAKARAT
jgi:hypothetical protein